MWYVCINMYKRVCTVNVNITFVITVRVIISDNNDTVIVIVIIDPCNIFLSCIPSIMYIHTVHVCTHYRRQVDYTVTSVKIRYFNSLTFFKKNAASFYHFYHFKNVAYSMHRLQL